MDEKPTQPDAERPRVLRCGASVLVLGVAFLVLGACTGDASSEADPGRDAPTTLAVETIPTTTLALPEPNEYQLTGQLTEGPGSPTLASHATVVELTTEPSSYKWVSEPISQDRLVDGAHPPSIGTTLAMNDEDAGYYTTYQSLVTKEDGTRLWVTEFQAWGPEGTQAIFFVDWGTNDTPVES